MEGGITVFLTLLILVGAGIGAFLLFGSGGYLRHKQMEGDMRDDPDAPRPEHRQVEDDAEATTNMPPPPPTRAAPPE